MNKITQAAQILRRTHFYRRRVTEHHGRVHHQEAQDAEGEC
jgi:hypothetical protein